MEISPGTPKFPQHFKNYKQQHHQQTLDSPPSPSPRRLGFSHSGQLHAWGPLAARLAATLQPSRLPPVGVAPL
jgi:hypothetical protein